VSVCVCSHTVQYTKLAYWYCDMQHIPYVHSISHMFSLNIDLIQVNCKPLITLQNVLQNVTFKMTNVPGDV